MPPERPACLVLVVGTGTEVGKTWVSARLLAGLRAGGLSVAARKPAQSYPPEDDPRSTDAAVLGRASGEPPTLVCPPHRWYPVAMAPPMAAEVLGRPPFSVADLVGELSWTGRGDGAGDGGATDGAVRVPEVGLVETAGGVRSPQAADGDAVDLARALRPDVVVLVADAGLGTINGVRLTVGALVEGLPGVAAGEGDFPGPPVLAVLNRFDAADHLHRRNREWLADRDGLEVVVSPGGLAALADRVASITRQPVERLDLDRSSAASRGPGSGLPNRSG